MSKKVQNWCGLFYYIFSFFRIYFLLIVLNWIYVNYNLNFKIKIIKSATKCGVACLLSISTQFALTFNKLFAGESCIDQISHLRWRIGDLDACGFKCIHFGVGSARFSGYNGTRVTHTSARWSCNAGNKRNDWLRVFALILLF